MSIFTFHLAKTNILTALKVYSSTLNPSKVPGLIHAECMTAMTLGSPIISTSRFLIRQIAVFAQWENQEAIDNFLTTHKFGKTLNKGWHTRLLYLRKWGHIDEFDVSKEPEEIDNPDAPVVAFTLARMRLLQVPRFINWGRPVEKLVRDHPKTTFAMAAVRLPNTVSTFSIWQTQKDMVKMVHGRSKVKKPKRHANAMKERDRKDFHYQFTTLRFKPIAEYGEWQGRKNLIPKLNTSIT